VRPACLLLRPHQRQETRTKNQSQNVDAFHEFPPQKHLAKRPEEDRRGSWLNHPPRFSI
jgi:hypothetical protein